MHLRKIYKPLFLLLGLIGGLTSSWAQNVKVHSLDEAISIAQEGNLDLQNLILEAQKAELEQKQAKSYRMPTITGSFGGQRNMELATTPLPAEIFGGEPGQIVNAQFGQEYTYNAGITISKQLFNRESVIQSKLSSMNADFVDFERATFHELLEEQITLYYYTALLAKRALVIGEQDLESAETIVELSRDKFDQGLSDAISLNTATINANAVKQSVNANKYLENQCTSELKKLLGLRPEDELLLTETIAYSLPESISLNELRGSAALKSSQLEVKQADMKVKLSQSSLWPTASISSYHGKQQFRNDFGLSFDNNAWTDYSYLSLNLSVPIFSGFTNRRSIKKSKFDFQKAQNEHEKDEIYQQLDDLRLVSDYQISLEDAVSAMDSYQLYAINKDLTYQKFNEGLVSLDQYLKTFEDYLKAENTYLNMLSKTYSYYSQLYPRIQ